MRQIFRSSGFRVILATGGALALVLVAAPLAQDVQAKQGSDQASSSRDSVSDIKDRVEQAQEEAKQRRDEAKTNVKNRLDDAKLRVCKQREKTIDNVMDRIGKRGGSHLEVIDVASGRIQKFYTDKHLTVANYDELLANVNATQQTAQKAVQAVKDAQADFKCDSNDPKGAADSFKTLMQARNDALRAYRDAVKDLLVAIKTANAAVKTSTGDQQ